MMNKRDAILVGLNGLFLLLWVFAITTAVCCPAVAVAGFAKGVASILSLLIVASGSYLSVRALKLSRIF